MKFITYQDYLLCLKIRSSFNFLQEESEEYKLYDHADEIDKVHDKMFRNLLSRKSEMEKLLKNFLKIKDDVKAKDLIQCHTDYVTKKYKNTQSDIVYKLKNKPIYFLIEHQSKVDKEMPERIFDYVHEIMREEVNNIPLQEEKIFPVVVPIVIYTGFTKWKAKTNFAQRQYQTEEYQKYLIHLQYNLISIQDYTFEELLETKSLIGAAMIFEKCRNAEELEEYTYKIIEVITKEKEKLKEIIMNFVARSVGVEKANKMIQKIDEKEERGMSPLTKMLAEMKVNALNEGWRGGKAEGKEEGIKEGKRQGIEEGIRKGEKKGEKKGERNAKIGMAKNMLKDGETEEKIMRYTEMTKEEIEKIKKEIKL